MIYFAWAEGTGMVKVGTTGVLAMRLEKMRTDCPFPVQLLGVMSGGRSKEARLHALLAASRANREWFAVTPKLVELVGRSRLTGEGVLWLMLNTEPRFAADYERAKGTWRESMFRLAAKAHAGFAW